MSRVRSRELSQASLYIVLALLPGEAHGYALMRRVEELSEGSVRMGPGTMYGTLGRLVTGGLIVEMSDVCEGKRARRTYELTKEGRSVAQAELDRMRALVLRLDGLRPAGTS